MSRSLLFVVMMALVAFVACTHAHAEGVEMAEAELVDDMFLEMYDLPASALKLTKFEQHMADQMEAEEGDELVELEMDEEPAAEAPALVKPTIEEGVVGLAEPTPAPKKELKPCPKEAAAKAAVLLEVVEAALEHVSEEPAADAPTLVKPTIEEGTVGLAEPTPAPAKKELKPCPKAAALLEIDDKSAPAPAAAADAPVAAERNPKVHVHVTTKVHGGPNSDNLIRVESKFDSLHDRVMGRLNRLMSRIDRHPDSIQDKTAEYGFTA